MVKDTHTEVYWQAYQQAIADGYDIRVARAEAMNAEKNARAAAKKAERLRLKAQKEKPEKPVKKSEAKAVREKGIDSLARVQLFAEVRQGVQQQAAALERLNQAKKQPLQQRDMSAELTPAQKKYLLTMYQLDSSIVRQVDVADKLGVTKASTHKVIHDLIDMGLVERYDRCSIALSEKGLFAAVSFHACYSAIVADLLRDLPPEKACQQQQNALEAVLRMPLELVQEIVRSRENFFAEKESLPASE